MIGKMESDLTQEGEDPARSPWDCNARTHYKRAPEEFDRSHLLKSFHIY